MKWKNMGTSESTISIVFGVMLFMLFWLHTLGRISVSSDKNIIFLMLVASIYLLITGSARINLFKYLMEKIKR